MSTGRVVDRRTLNRTLLDRQLLSARSDLAVLGAVERLVAVQAQEPNWPHVGLWSRLTSFTPEDLAVQVGQRTVVRGSALRGTQHLVGAEDYRWLRPTLQPLLDRIVRAPWFARGLPAVDPAMLAGTARDLLGDGTLPRRELGRLLAAVHPGADSRALAGAAELLLPLVHGPVTSAWGRWGTRSGIAVTRAEAWLGRPMQRADAERLVLRHLAAFGPAGVPDVQAWSGLTRLREVVDGMRGELRVHHDEDGREVFDLPDAHLADPDLPAPVRFLPAYDNVLLGHADRARLLADGDRRQVLPGRAVVRPTFLVDGFVAGTWAPEDGRIRIAPFRPLGPGDTAAVQEEAGRLSAFLAGQG